jgi:hypothetical protein
MTTVIPCERCDDTGWVCEAHDDRPGTAARRRVRAHAARPACRARRATRAIRRDRSRDSRLKRADCLAPGGRDRNTATTIALLT